MIAYVSMLDACDILMTEGHSFAALLPVRAAFEASVYIDWISKEDSQNRARHYLVSNLRDERTWAKRSIPGTPERAAFTQAIGMDAFTSPDSGSIEGQGRKQLADIDRLLGDTAFASIDGAFTRKRGTRIHDPEWFKVLGKQSLRQIVEDVNRLREYQMLYTRGSDAMHAGSYKDHISFMKGKRVRLRHIRHLTDGRDALTFAMMQAIHTYRVIVEHYRPGEKDALARRYVERWQTPWKSIPEVTYKIA